MKKITRNSIRDRINAGEKVTLPLRKMFRLFPTVEDAKAWCAEQRAEVTIKPHGIEIQRRVNFGRDVL